MLPSEYILRKKCPEIGDSVIDDHDLTLEEIAKFIILVIVKWTWPFIAAQYLIISTYVVYWR